MKKNILLLTSLLLAFSLASCSSENKSPTVKITSPTEGAKLSPKEIQFQGEWSDSDGSIETIEWDFGDGAKSSEKTPGHNYSKSGQYSVTLNVTDNRKATSTAHITIFISSGSKAAAFVRAVTDTSEVPLKFISGKFPMVVELDGTRSTSDSSIKSYRWELGDGKTSDEAKLLYKYEIPGDYEVSLTVTDEHATSSKDTIAVRVLAPEKSSFTLGNITYYLDKQNQLNSLDQSSLKTFVYRYVIDAESLRSHLRFTKDEVKAILLDAIQRAATAPRVGKATIWLFSEFKNNFMAPSNYDHYLGLADWEAPAEPNSAQILFNEKYFVETAPSVYGYLVQSEPVENERAEYAQVYLDANNYCQKHVIYTLEEIVRTMASKDAFLLDVFGKDSTTFLGSFAALRGDLSFERASLSRLKIQPSEGEKMRDPWRIRYLLPTVPNC